MYIRNAALPEARFGLKVFLPASLYMCVSASVCQPRACPGYNLIPIQATTIKFRTNDAIHLGFDPYCFWKFIDFDLQGQI